jgi:hypothetical protein
MRTMAAIAVLIAICLTAATAGAAEPAEPPQIYVGSGDGHSIAFKVEAGRTFVLGLDATVYCISLEPQEPSKPTLNKSWSATSPTR